MSGGMILKSRFDSISSRPRLSTYLQTRNKIITNPVLRKNVPKARADKYY